MTQTLLLEDVVDINPESIGKNYQFDNILYLDTSAVTENVFSQLQYFELKNAPSRAKRIVRDGDIVYSTVRPNLKHYGYIQNPKENTVASTGFAVVRAKKGIDSRFIYYWLACDERNKYLTSIAESQTSTFPAFNPSILGKLKIELPEEDSQKKIADILGTIDEKIELNQKMNDTLEQMGQALFREYYTSNYKAKSTSLEKIANLVRGIEPGSKNYTTEKLDNSVTFLRVGDLSQRSSNLFVNQNLTKGKLANADDVLVSFDGAPGLVSLGLSGCYSSGIRKISPKNNDISKAYLYFLMKSSEVQTIIDRYAEGTTIKHASKSITHILAPQVDKCEAEEPLSDIFEQLVFNTLQNNSLINFRDSLLPRLISGKIKV